MQHTAKQRLLCFSLWSQSKWIDISINKKNARKTGGGEAEEECLSTVEEDVFQIIKKVSVEGHDVSESKVFTSFDDEVTSPRTGQFLWAGWGKSIFIYKANRESGKQLSNNCRIKYTTAENSAFLYNATEDYTEKVAKKIGE
jgi:hypothetical protein